MATGSKRMLARNHGKFVVICSLALRKDEPTDSITEGNDSQAYQINI